jgi:hypothetical protein
MPLDKAVELLTISSMSMIVNEFRKLVNTHVIEKDVFSHTPIGWLDGGVDGHHAKVVLFDNYGLTK